MLAFPPIIECECIEESSEPVLCIELCLLEPLAAGDGFVALSGGEMNVLDSILLCRPSLFPG